MKALFLALGLLVSSIANADYYSHRTDYYPQPPSASFTIPLNDSGASFSFSTNSYYSQPPVYYAPPPVIIYRQPPQYYYGNGYHREWRRPSGYYNHRHHGHHHHD